MATTTKTRKPRATKATEVKPKSTKAKATTTTAKGKGSTTKAKTTAKAKETGASTAKRGTASASKSSTAKATTAKAKSAKATPAKKTTAKKTTAAKTEKVSTGEGRALNVHGFVPGTDSALIVEAMIEGGADRSEVNSAAASAIESTNGLATRAGAQKNIPSLASSLLKRLQEKGYTVESSWKVVPPKEVQDQMKKEAQAAKRRAARAAKK